MDAEQVVEQTLDRADRVFRSGLGSTLGILREADRELSDRLHDITKRRGGGKAKFSEASAVLYRQQIKLTTEYLEKRLAGFTHQQAKAAVASGVTNTVRLAKTLEHRFTGVLRPLNLEQQHFQDEAVRNAGASLLRKIDSSCARYGLRMISDFERVLRTSLLQGLTQHQVVSRLVKAGELGGVKAKVLHQAEPAYFPKPTGYMARRYWAERIVRTEQSYAYNAANLQTIQIAKVVDFPDLQKKILAHFDNRTAPDSIAVHGQIRPVDGYFHDGAGRDYLHPPARPHDREVVIPWRPRWRELPNTREASEAEREQARKDASPQPEGATEREAQERAERARAEAELRRQREIEAARRREQEERRAEARRQAEERARKEREEFERKQREWEERMERQRLEKVAELQEARRRAEETQFSTDPRDVRVRKLGVAIGADDWATARAMVREAIAELVPGATSKDRYRLKPDVVEVDPNIIAGAAAYHGWDGKIGYHERMLERLKRFGASAARGVYERKEISAEHIAHLQYAHTLIHEETHGHSKVTTSSYRLGGSVLEEVGTELNARYVTRNLTKAIAAHRERLGLDATDTGPYQSIIDPLGMKIREKLPGLSLESTQEIVRRAHAESSLKQEGAFRSKEEAIGAFVAELPPAARAVAEQHLMESGDRQL